jgi:uncharacterized protein YcbK (DUF882 family)
MNSFIVKNWEVLAGLFGTSVLFISGIRLKRQNEKTTELENLKTVRSIEKALIDDVKLQVEELLKLNNYLKGIVDTQKNIIDKYRAKFGEI